MEVSERKVTIELMQNRSVRKRGEGQHVVGGNDYEHMVLESGQRGRLEFRFL